MKDLRKMEEKKMRKFEMYIELIKRWMKVMSLVSFKEDELWDEVIFDSLVPYLMDLEPFKTGNMRAVDVGSGAGIPGIPLAVVMDTWEFHLVESVRKKVEFLKLVVSELKLSNVLIHHERIEEFSRREKNREKYDVVLERAVAPTPVMVEYSAPLLKVGGEALIYGGIRNHSEIERGLNLLGKLGLELKDIHWYSLRESSKKRCIINLRKVGRTPSSYPRRTGIALKKPLWR